MRSRPLTSQPRRPHNYLNRQVGVGVLELSAETLEASAEYGALPDAGTVTISNTGTAPLTWTASDDQAWMSVSASSGTLSPGESRILTVTYSDTALGVGLNEGVVTVTDTTNNSDLELAVERTVVGVPFLEVSSASVVASAEYGSTPDAQTVTLSNTGSGPTEWSLSDDMAWLGVSPASGTLAAGASIVLTLSFSDATLAVTMHTGTVTITGANGAMISVSRTVSYSLLSNPSLSHFIRPTGSNLWQDAGVTPSGVGDPIGQVTATVGPNVTGTTTKRPTRQTSGDFDVIRFDGIDDVLIAASASTYHRNMAVLAVIDPTSGFVIENGAPPYIALGGWYFNDIAGAAPCLRSIDRVSLYPAVSVGWAGTSKVCVAMFLYYNGTDCTILYRKNGVTIDSTHGALTVASTSVVTYIGARYDNSIKASFDLFELAALTSDTPGTIQLTDVQEAEAYLMDRYGIS